MLQQISSPRQQAVQGYGAVVKYKLVMMNE